MAHSVRNTLMLGLIVASLSMLGLSQSDSQTDTQNLKLIVEGSKILDFPADVRQISTDRPKVADFAAVSSKQLRIDGKSSGSTRVIVWLKDGTRVMYQVTVDSKE